MDIKQYLDATYLKTAEQAGISEQEDTLVVERFIQETIAENFKLVMIRPKYVALARKIIDAAKSSVLVGTVIGFPEGAASIEEKLQEATIAINDGADDLDFVCNYQAFIEGKIDLVKEEILKGTQLAISHHKTAKWIIEIAALNSQQIVQLSCLIKNVVISNFDEKYYNSVFVKSSTGFYQTENNLPNGATIPAILMMIENSFPLPVKAAGGVKTFEDAVEMISLGVKRIGTSSATAIANKKESKSGY